MAVFNPKFVRNFDKTVKPLDCPASTVGTSTSLHATAYAYQRKCFYANGKFWVFYSDGTNLVVYYSSDGATWHSCPQNPIRACDSGYKFSVWFDGTHLHYAYAYASVIYYRRGTPNADGTITWSAVEQTVNTTYDAVYYPFVSVDSNGYVWIGYSDYTGAILRPYVIKSGNNDGTWGTTPGGFPYPLKATAGWRVSIIPLTAGKILAIYAVTAETIKAKRWDGSAWGSEVATTTGIEDGYAFSAVAQGDDVHVAFLVFPPILYVKYTYSSNSFGAETTLQAGASFFSIPVISIDSATNDLYVFYATKTANQPPGHAANHIFYMKYDGSWGSAVDWIDESANVLARADRLTCFYKDYGGYIGLAYMTLTESPYDIRFDFLTIGVPPPPPPKGTIAVHAKVAGII